MLVDDQSIQTENKLSDQFREIFYLLIVETRLYDAACVRRLTAAGRRILGVEGKRHGGLEVASMCHKPFHGQESCGRQSRAIGALLDQITGFVPRNVTALKEGLHTSAQSPKTDRPQSKGVKIFGVKYTL